jgi:hypothetical protein
MVTCADDIMALFDNVITLISFCMHVTVGQLNRHPWNLVCTLCRWSLLVSFRFLPYQRDL